MYYVSLYNTLMKIFFITSTAFIIYLMRFRRPFNATYDKVADDFPHYYLPIAAAVLTCIVQSGWTPWEMVWSFSLWLEAMAFIPQIIMLQKTRVIEGITSHYVAALGLYRFFYILNWIYRWQVEGTYCLTQILSGTLQTGLYCDFLYHYYQAFRKGENMVELPI